MVMVLILVLIFVLVRLTVLTHQVAILAKDLSETKSTLAYTAEQVAKNVTDLHKTTDGLSQTLSNTEQNLHAVTVKVGGVEQTVGSISGTVGKLEKLAEVDPQLLKKYSKVYFMNENYVPAHLTTLPVEYTYSTTKQEQFLTEAWPYLRSMINAANAEGVTLYVKSGYRSFQEQKSLKSQYAVLYGAGTANSFSAEQGYSEHQLGTAIDIITPGVGGTLTTAFDRTSAYTWLQNNAYRFGFVLSYPKGNTYYVYEPWHWRYVGVKLATYLHSKNLHFYDLDQREIDKYLITFFD